MKKWLIISVCLSLAVYGNAQAVEDVSDVELWTGVSLKYNFNKRLQFKLEEQLRLKDNLTTFSQLLTEGTLTYDPGKIEFLKPLELSIGSRYVVDNDTEGKQQGIEYFFRYNLDAEYKFDFGRFYVDYRFRFQSRNELGITELDGDIPVNDLRHRIGFKYNFDDWKLDPKLQVELFSRNDDQTTYNFSRFRLRLGSDYSFVKRQDLDFFLLYEQTVGKVVPERIYGIGLGYEFDLKR
jgi:hypothetical protein